MTKREFFIHEFKIGLKSYKTAISTIFNNKMAIYFVIPFILNIVLLIFGIKYIFELVEYSTKIFREWINFDSSDFLGRSFVKEFFYGLITTILYIVFFITYMLISGNIITILLSPMFSLISEKTDTLLTGNEYKFELKQFLKDIFRGIFISARNTIIELFFMVIMLFVSFIPVIGFFSPVFMLIISAYFYGFSFLDYSNERNKMSIRKSVEFVRKHKGLVISNGLVFSIFLFIPFCGSFIAIFVSIISVVAATISAVQVNDLNIKK